MATVVIDDRAYQVDERRNLLETCLELGFDLPYFCWHPAMGSVGSCRQCAVKQFSDDADSQGRIVMACMTPAADGTRIAIEEDEARAFRASVIEWLMVNHPHDCPVCDEGGECHLQDVTVMTGHHTRRYRGRKRTYRNQDLGPFLTHEMNRCIQCFRCVRFYRDVAGGRDLDVFGAHDHLYFGRQEDGVLESEFSGNLAEVCPTGVFTDKTLARHYTRKWDLACAPSVCVHCSLGCNTSPAEREGSLRRISNRFNSQVNGYFLCDRGRYGYEFVHDPGRIRAACIRSPDPEAPAEPADGPRVLEEASRRIAGRAVIGIGSARASVESNFALKTLVGAGRFYRGVAPEEDRAVRLALEIYRGGCAPPASIQDVERADAVLVLGEDLIHTAPRLALAARQSVQQQPMAEVDKLGIPRWHAAAVRTACQDRHGPLYVLDVQSTWLDDVATGVRHLAPDDLARVGQAVAQAIHPSAPAVPDLPSDLLTLAREIARALRRAERPVIVSGTSLRHQGILRAAANAAWALRATEDKGRLGLVMPGCNSLGLAMLGGRPLEEAFGVVASADAAVAIVLETDLYRCADARHVDALLTSLESVVVLDHLRHRTADRAHVVVPVATFAEAEGTLVNNEGRAQRFYQVIPPPAPIQEGWRWVRDLAGASGWRSPAGLDRWRSLDDLHQALVASEPTLSRLRDVAPDAAFRVAGQRIPRAPHRYSGRTALVAHRTVHEPRPPEDPDSPLAFSMEGTPRQPPSPLLPFVWAPAWNSSEALNKFQREVGGPLREEMPGVRLFDETVAPGLPYPGEPPPAFVPRADEWLVVPLPRIFGSEELSARAPAVRERVPPDSVVLCSQDARRLGVAPGEDVSLRLADTRVPLPVTVDDAMPPGIAGLVMGDPLSPWQGAQWARISKERA